jgi:hypothetical protein
MMVQETAALRPMSYETLAFLLLVLSGLCLVLDNDRGAMALGTQTHAFLLLLFLASDNGRNSVVL